MTKEEAREHAFQEGETVRYHGQEAQIVRLYPEGVMLKRAGGSFITVIYSEIQTI